MNNSRFKNFMTESFGINSKLLDLSSEVETLLIPTFSERDEIAEYHQAKVLKAFQDSNVSDIHFSWNTGYGYDDLGRETVEKVFARAFNAESALVRPNIVNGTHAISLALLGLLRQGDKVIYATGKPYDTLQSVIGYEHPSNQDNGTLKDLGVLYEEISLKEGDIIDLDKLASAIDQNVKMVAIQRSKGYSFHNSIMVNQIREVADFVHSIRDDIIVMVDNCYCEFVEFDDPISAGADVVCGSLIKNPGGGLALSGGYVVGKSELIDRISYRLTCPGIGGECGLTFGQNRAVLQGLFQAPRVTAGAVKGAILCGHLFHKLGFEVSPSPDIDHMRCDIIQGVKLGSPEAVQAFCEGIQKAAPVESNVTPVPAPMPGYDDMVIMAAGTFVQGASIELSADGPLRAPYNVYFQGGLTYEHSKIGVLMAAQKLIEAGIIDL